MCMSLELENNEDAEYRVAVASKGKRERRGMRYAVAVVHIDSKNINLTCSFC